MLNRNIDEKNILEIDYPRNDLSVGDEIQGVEKLREIREFLDEAEEVVISLYWKPLGDSLLFLSIAQAIYDYRVKIREGKVNFVIDKKFSDLISKIEFLADAKIVESGLEYFKQQYKSGRKVFLITDDDPFWEDKEVPLFNSEEYKYPRYTISQENLIYSSRPSRYYLNFERELGIKLFDPNNSLPFFILNGNREMQSKIFERYGLNFKTDKIATIISQTSKVEKKFGLLKYLQIAKVFLEKSPANKVLFLVNPNEESPSEWIKFRENVRKVSSRLVLYPYESDDFVELAYILARSTFVLGNDTGFSHLAAMCKESNDSSSTPTYIIYSKHDYTKWTTGYSEPITTKLADYLAMNNMSVRREKINQDEWGDQAFAYSIPVSRVLKYLNLG